MEQECRHIIGFFRTAVFSRRVGFRCVFVASFIALLALIAITDEGIWDVFMPAPAGIPIVRSSNISKPTKGCKLPKLDPLDASILGYLDPTYNPMANCSVTFVPKTRIRDGRIELIPKFSKGIKGCKFRCHHPEDDYNARLGPWLDISHSPECDVVEVRCRDESGSVSYEYVHTQIFVPQRAAEDTAALGGRGRTLSSRAPDVHLLVMDSVSSAQFMRSMPKSLRFLEEEMGAINFRHVSKVGKNSRPNAYALFFGKQPLTEDEWDSCGTPLDDEPFIGFQFKRRGYKTMMAEDWALGTLMWPWCEGFTRTPVDHYMRPLQLLYDKSTEPDKVLTADQRKWNDKLIKGQCRGTHSYLLDYLKDFIDAYPAEPKFSITWMIDLAHENVNGPYEMDEPFLRFLREYKEKLSNAFFFVMSDHGFRLGGIRETKQGEIEDNNPALVLAVPKQLRKNRRLMATVKENSKHLVTHFDTHATLISIAREAARMTASSPFDHTDTSPWDGTLLGESYLHPFNLTAPRTCQNQRVPLEYCICQNRLKNVTREKQPLARRIAKFVVGGINDFLRNHSALDVCAELSFDRKSTVSLLYLVDEGVYHITLRTLPNHGSYETHVKVNNEDYSWGREEFVIVAQKVARLDAYDAQSKCLDTYDVRPFCYCRDFMSGGK